MQTNTTGVTNLLRMARSECRSALAFASITSADETETLTFPDPATDDTVARLDVDELVAQLAADPEFAHGRVFVRSVRLPEPFTLAVAPVRAGGGSGLLGVAAHEGQEFDQIQLEYIEGLGRRLARHLEARKALTSVSAAPSGSRADATYTPPQPPAAGEPAPDRRAEDGGPTLPAVAQIWAQNDPVTGMASVGQFFSRAGRLLGSDARTTSALAVVLVEVPDRGAAAAAAQALGSQLRYSDPLARIEQRVFAAAVLLFPGSTRGEAVEERLASAARAAVVGPVRTAHVLAEPGDRRDVDELLREAFSSLDR